MTGSWDSFSAAELRELVAALQSERLSSSPSALSLQRLYTVEKANWLAAELARLAGPAGAVADLLELLATERARVEQASDSVELVWTGPEIPGMANRHTGAVVRELFATARSHLLIVGYAIHRGREIFSVLADRMDADPELQVRLVVDIKRGQGDTSMDAEVVRHFAAQFRKRDWPGERVPEVLFDPRSLNRDRAHAAAMHAKCIVVDDSIALITSANFTTAAQTKNIEVGLLARSSSLARQTTARFDALVQLGALVPIPGLCETG